MSSARPAAIVTVDNHHEVLTAWAALRRRTGRSAVALTLDHHTDVLPAFGRRADAAERLEAFDFRSPEAVADAVLHLRHDEHIDLALRSSILARSFIICHENFTPPAHPEMVLLHDPALPDPQAMLNDAAAFRPFADAALESVTLERLLPEAFPPADAPFILDIDLDYLLTARAAAPRDPSRLLALVARADLITIALESDWLRLLRLPGETIDSAAQKAALLRLFTTNDL